MKSGLSLFLFAALFRAASVMAQEPYPLNPVEQPLAVVRMREASAPRLLLETRQARALDLAKRDFSGSLPGLGMRVASLKDLAGYLETTKASSVWYCITQRGSSLARQTGGMGWQATLPAEENEQTRIATDLKAAGLDTERGLLELRRLDSGRFSVSLNRDADTRKELLAKGRQEGSPWRDSLEAFLRTPADGFGVWVNTRPLMGLATLLGNIDIRGALAQMHLSTPNNASLDLFNNNGDLGFTIRLDSIFTEDRWDDWFYLGRHVRSRPDALMTLTIAAPEQILAILDINRATLALSGLKLDSVLPESINIAVWRDDGGALRWHAVCLLRAAGGNNQLRRVEQWLENIAGPGVLSLGKIATADGKEATQFRLGDLSLVGLAVTHPDGAASDQDYFYLLAGDIRDLPQQGDLEILEDDEDFSIASWHLRPDAAARHEAIALLTDMAGTYRRIEFDAEFFDVFLPESDSGYLEEDFGALILSSRSGLTPWLIPAVIAAAKERLPVSNTSSKERITAKRLRFLLDIVSQSRFRNLDAATGEAREWPDRWTDVLGANGVARRWLDRAFGDFPGDPRQTSAAIDSLANGGELDGVLYLIARGDDTMFIVAEMDGDNRLRIDTNGVMQRKEGELWKEYQEDFADLW